MKVMWEELVWVEPQISPVPVFLMKVFFFYCKTFLLTSYRGRQCTCVKIKYYRATCPSAMLFYIFHCPKNPSVAIVVDVKAYDAVRCCQWAELLLREVLGSGMAHQDSCSTWTEWSLCGCGSSKLAQQGSPCYKLMRNHLPKFYFLSLISYLIVYFRKKTG